MARDVIDCVWQEHRVAQKMACVDVPHTDCPDSAGARADERFFGVGVGARVEEDTRNASAATEL